jgi:hypothetical protein
MPPGPRPGPAPMPRCGPAAAPPPRTGARPGAPPRLPPGACPGRPDGSPRPNPPPPSASIPPWRFRDDDRGTRPCRWTSPRGTTPSWATGLRGRAPGTPSHLSPRGTSCRSVPQGWPPEGGESHQPAARRGSGWASWRMRGGLIGCRRGRKIPGQGHRGPQSQAPQLEERKRASSPSGFGTLVDGDRNQSPLIPPRKRRERHGCLTAGLRGARGCPLDDLCPPGHGDAWWR